MKNKANNRDTEEIFNLIFLNINKTIEKHTDLYFEFPNKNKKSHKNSKGTYLIESHDLKEDVRYFESQDLKEHVRCFGTTGLGKSSSLMERVYQNLINIIIKDSDIILKHVINDIIFLLDKKEDRGFLTIINTISLKYYRKEILNFNQSFIISLFNLNMNEKIINEINNLNYFKISFLILKKTKTEVFSEINEENFESLIKLSNVIDY